MKEINIEKVLWTGFLIALFLIMSCVASFGQLDITKRNVTVTDNFHVRGDTVLNAGEVNSAISTAESNNIEWPDTNTIIATQYDLQSISVDTTNQIATKYDVDSLAENVYMDLGNKIEDETDPIYAADSNSLLKWSDTLSTGKIATKYDLIEKTETVSRTIYVATTGSDVTGTGLVGAPFATPLKAYRSIKTIINTGVTITINIGVGTYNSVSLSDIGRELTTKTLLGTGTILTVTNLLLVKSGFTLVAGSPNAYVYTVSGITLVANEVQDMFLKSGTAYFPIAHNTTNTIYAVTGAEASTEIYTPQAIFNLTDLNLTLNSSTPMASVIFQGIKFVGSGKIQVANVGVEIDFTNCYFDCGGTTTAANTQQTTWKECSFKCSGGNTVGSTTQRFDNCMLRKSGSAGNAGLSYSNIPMQRIQRGIYLYNWASAFDFRSCVVNYDVASNNVVIDNCTIGFNISNNMEVIFTSIVNVYILTVTTLVAHYETLTGNYKIIISSLIGTPTTLVSSGAAVNGYVNPQKNVCIAIPGIYPEQSQSSATLTNNAATNITVGNTAQNNSIHVEYTLSRGSGYRTGSFDILYDGTTTYLSPDTFIDNGVAGVDGNAIVFSTSISTTNILLTGTLDASGGNATFSYSVTRKMK